MSENHTRELMVKYFPNCPICKSDANYTISPSNTVVQCNSCKAKFMSDDFADIQKDLTGLLLFKSPLALVDKTLMPTLISIEHKTFPVSFWQNLKTTSETELKQSLNEYGTEKGMLEETENIAPYFLIDENKMILASILLKYRENIPKITKNYVMLWDQTLIHNRWDNMIQAINLMSEYGWKCISFSTFFDPTGLKAAICHALMEKTNTNKIEKTDNEPIKNS